MKGVGKEINYDKLARRIAVCDFLSAAQIFLQDNFLLERPLDFADIKPRLLGHWGSCHGVNLAYANLRAAFSGKKGFSFVLGPGHAFPALQANLFYDGNLRDVDDKATHDWDGLRHLCRDFSWPGGFPSHSSPMTPGVIAEGGELGYALATAFGSALGHPEKTIAVLIGDGELETGTALSSLNLHKLVGESHGHVLPILHLNGYKISGPTIYGRKSERELHEFIRGFGYNPVEVGEDLVEFQTALREADRNTFLIMRTEKGYGSPKLHDAAHQVPLPRAKSDPGELHALEEWLRSYDFKLEDLA